ncbi:filamentous hemagglutinin N-terminal domain-containing protein, partial [Citrobacter braakii]
MNKIYRLKFDKHRNELVVVSELTVGAGKTQGTVRGSRELAGCLSPLALLTGLILGLLPAMTLANPPLPTGGNIVAGQGGINSSGNQMTVNQNSQNMVVNWNSFDIGKNHTVQFIQPGSSSAVLNRVTGGHESQILGTLQANGQVFLINPNGVLFGGGAKVNTAGFMASTKGISDADFMKGARTFSGGSKAGTQIINQGNLSVTKGGFIVLAADRVSNSGTITAPSGKVVLASAQTVTLQLDGQGLTSVTTNGSVVNALVENHGLVAASDGKVWLTAKGRDMLLNTVVNNNGTLAATGLTERGGSIVLDGGDSGVLTQAGILLADGKSSGGKITVEGENIHLASGSLISATGKAGGGEVHVGGGWQGKDRSLHNASKVVMDKGASIDVSSTQTGNGGTVTLWSDDYTGFRGNIRAQGGSFSGNGGQVETSSLNNLQVFGNVDSSAAQGKGGNWLLDPADVTIVSTGGDANIGNTSGIFSPTASGSQILNTSINDQLNNGASVTVKTSGTDSAGQLGNITVNADINKTAGGDAKLTLLADHNITIASHNITSSDSANALDVNLKAGNTSENSSITLNNVKIATNGGDVLLGQANATNNVIVKVTNDKISAGNITIEGKSSNESSAVVFGGNNIITSTGNIIINGSSSGCATAISVSSSTMNADNNISVSGISALDAGMSIGWNTSLEAGNSLSLNATSHATTTGFNLGGAFVFKGKNGVNINSLSDGWTGMYISESANATISSAQGDVIISAFGNKGGYGLQSTGQSLDINALEGNVSITAGAGNQAGGAIGLSKGNIKAKKNIIINATESPMSINFTNTTLTSADGNVTLTGDKVIDLTNTVVNATDNVNITASGSVIINNANMIAGNNISVSGVSALDAGMSIGGSTSLVAGNSLSLNATSHASGTTGFRLGEAFVFKGKNGVNINSLSDGWTGMYISGSANATISSAQGDIIITAFGNKGGYGLQSTGQSLDINALEGNVSITTGAGNQAGGAIGLSKGNIKAKKNIIINATESCMSINFTNTALTSVDGNVNITASGSVIINSANMMAGNNISISGVGTDFRGNDYNGQAINVSSSSLAANNSVVLAGVSNFTLLAFFNEVVRITSSNISATNLSVVGNAHSLNGQNAGGTGVYISGVNFSLSNGVICGTTDGGYDGNYDNTPAVALSGPLSLVHGNLTINANGGNNAIGFYGSNNITLNVNEGSNLSINAISNMSNGWGACGSAFVVAVDSEEQIRAQSLTVQGGGNLTINATNNGTSGNAIALDNLIVCGTASVNLTGQSNGSGNGVGIAGIQGGAGNVLITGVSNNGSGVALGGVPATSGNGSASNATIIGSSSSGSGVIISGNGSLSGTGVTGSSINGSGVVLSSNLSSTTNTNIAGNSTNGAGMKISGHLTGNSNTTITGSGNTTGVNIIGGATVNGANVSGNSTNGSGVEIGGNVTGGTVTGSGNTTGVSIIGSATVNDTNVSGNATNGSGVDIGG